MSKVEFNLDANNWTAAVDRDHPIGDPLEVGVVTDLTDGGQQYAYDKGIDVQHFDLVYNKLTAADDVTLRNWHANISRGPLIPFTFKDEDGNNHTVYWMDKKYPIKSNNNNRYSGTIRLRKEI